MKIEKVKRLGESTDARPRLRSPQLVSSDGDLREALTRRGQAMLIAVLALGGAILGATTIAGFLMVYQIRQTTDSANSAKAVFAADAGTEWALYNFFVNSSTPMFTLSNGATTTVTCIDVSGNPVDSCADPNAAGAISKGFANDAARAFLVTFGTTSTTPEKKSDRFQASSVKEILFWPDA